MFADFRLFVNLVLGYNYYNVPSHAPATVKVQGEWKHFDSIAPAMRVNGPVTNKQVHHDAICGECYEPASVHPIIPTAYGAPYCYRNAEDIGQDIPDYGMYSNEDLVHYDKVNVPNTVSSMKHVEDYNLMPKDRLRMDKASHNDEDFDVNGFPFRRYDGPGTREDVNAWDAFEPEFEADLSNWKDNDAPVAIYKDVNGKRVFDYWTNLSTHVTDWWTKDLKGEYPANHRYAQAGDYSTTPESSNVYVEGFDGFLTIPDPAMHYATALYHNHLLNVFVDKQTKDLRVGGIRIVKNFDGTITAQCVNGLCNVYGGKPGRMTINPTTAERTDLEEFVLAVIAHGNNHAAKFMLNKVVLGEPVWYKVHRPECDLDNCDPKSSICTALTDRVTHAISDDTVVKFLMAHNDVCRDANCECDVRLVELVPALAHI